MEKLVRVKLLFFAKSRELAGLSECETNFPEQIVCSKLVQQISEAYNLHLIQENCIIALNGEYCDKPDTILTLKSNDEIAVIPPISGG